MKTYKLINGLELPAVGLGAIGIWGGESELHSDLYKREYEIYSYALESGQCKLFDTSESYGYNEMAIGEAMSNQHKRSEVMIMSKVGNASQRNGDIRFALEKSLNRLKTDYLDIYLIHWPQTGTYVKTWLQMEKLYEEGVVKAIGVCNCNKHHIAAIKNAGHIVPMINEFELHPLFTQDALVNYCYAKDIQTVAYSPLGRMHDVLMKAGPIRALSDKYGKSKVQIILRWHYQLGRITIPQTLNRQHFDEIFSIDDFELSAKEIAWISSLNDNIRLRYNPDTCDFSVLG